jgi:hypothetical protein
MFAASSTAVESIGDAKVELPAADCRIGGAFSANLILGHGEDWY